MAAIWSLVFGISSFCLWILGAIPALILGTVALININKSQDQLEGKRLAIAGVITGGMGLFMGLFSVAMLAGMFMPAFAQVQAKAKITQQTSQVNLLVISCQSYALDHDGDFPVELKDLHPEYIDDESLLKTFGERGSKNAPYIYFPGYTDSSPAKTKLLIATPATIAGSRVMALVGGEVVDVPEEEFQRLMEAQKGE